MWIFCLTKNMCVMNEKGNTVPAVELRSWNCVNDRELRYLYDNLERSCYDDCFIPQKDDDESLERIRVMRFYHRISTPVAGGLSKAVVVDGKVSGYVMYQQLCDILSSACSMEIALLPEVYRCGVGTEVMRQMINHAFAEEHYRDVVATVDKRNAAAIALLQKLGFFIIETSDVEKYGESDSEPSDLVDIILKDNEPYLERCEDDGEDNLMRWFFRRPLPETKNGDVEIRKFHYSDVLALAKLYKTVDTRYDNPPLVSDDEKEMLYDVHQLIGDWKASEFEGGDIYRAILEDGKVVGLVALYKQEGNQHIDAYIGYMLMPEACGRGVATKVVAKMLDEAFADETIHHLTARVYAPNIASKRVLEKNGFCLEGTKREAVMCEGKPTDYLFYGLLRSEYMKRGTAAEKKEE